MDVMLMTSQDTLMRVFKFTPADLAANRDGGFSDHQIAQFKRRAQLFGGMMIAGLIVMTLTFSQLPESRLDPEPSPIVVFGFLLALALTGFTGVELFVTVNVWRRGVVQRARGQVSLTIDPKRRTFGKLNIGEFEMYVPKSELAVLQDGAIYALYYVTPRKQIISLELIEP
ncbi:MAG: hypothetical protein MUF87_21355 [Anaerolineae bacterium]|jgi:hypothetical protein|nr:hypothetical protein [Anaerolineae bacterium]